MTLEQSRGENRCQVSANRDERLLMVNGVFFLLLLGIIKNKQYE